MKISTNTSFPHPVVTPDGDDITDTIFKLISPSAAGDGVNYHVKLNFDINNNEIKKHIDKGNAGFALHVEASNLFFRRVFDDLEQNQSIQIEGDEVIGKVVCTPFILVYKPIPKYKISLFHEDYEKNHFKLKEGDVLAIGNSFTFEADKEYDPFDKLSSIMQVLPGEQHSDGIMDIDLSGEKISIYISKSDHSEYTKLNQISDIGIILLQSVALPALTNAITAIKDDSYDQSLRWYQAIKKRIKVLEISIENTEPLMIASQLLNGSLTKTFKTLDNLINNGEGE